MGSVASRLLLELPRDVQVCVTVTLTEGSPLNETARHQTVRRRCLVAFGNAQIVTDHAAKHAALRLISQHLIPDRWADVDAPVNEDLNASTVLKFSMDEVFAEARCHSAEEVQNYVKHPVWAGVVPLELKALPPIPDEELCEGTPIPASVLHYIARRRTVHNG